MVLLPSCLCRRDVAHCWQGVAEDQVVAAEGFADEGAGDGQKFAGVSPVGDDCDAGEAVLLDVLIEGEIRGGGETEAGGVSAAAGWEGEGGEAQQEVDAVDSQ